MYYNETLMLNNAENDNDNNVKFLTYTNRAILDEAVWYVYRCLCMCKCMCFIVAQIFKGNVMRVCVCHCNSRTIDIPSDWRTQSTSAVHSIRDPISFR